MHLYYTQDCTTIVLNRIEDTFNTAQNLFSFSHNSAKYYVVVLVVLLLL